MIKILIVSSQIAKIFDKKERLLQLRAEIQWINTKQKM